MTEINKENQENHQKKEYRFIRPIRDACYYSCSMLNTTNILLCILIIILLIFMFK